jgi:HAD superfamily hydrolase (TIGR01509 family)
MKKIILWDHDGVLVETEPLYYEATRSLLAELGIEISKYEYLRDMAHGTSAWNRALAAGVQEAVVKEYKARRNRRYQELLISEQIDIDGVEEVLETLADRYSMAIVTTSKKEDFELIHRHRNICRHMSFVLASGDYPRSKPHPDPYLTALNRFGVVREEAVVVEDSERGLRSAIAAGIDCIVVKNDFVKGQDFRAASYQIDSLKELPELLGTL